MRKVNVLEFVSLDGGSDPPFLVEKIEIGNQQAQLIYFRNILTSEMAAKAHSSNLGNFGLLCNLQQLLTTPRVESTS